MELKNKKTKKQTKGKINTIIENDNPNATTETAESIFIQRVETKDDFINSSNNTLENKKENNKKLFFVYVPWVLLVIFLTLSFYFWFQLSDIKKDSLKAEKAETTETVNTVGKIMLLPKDESPKIATLTEDDLSKIKTQPFFVNAKVGDKVLVYTIAKKVILYSPNLNKIVEVANLNSDNGSVVQSAL
jgi:hypothetical protein